MLPTREGRCVYFSVRATVRADMNDTSGAIRDSKRRVRVPSPEMGRSRRSRSHASRATKRHWRICRTA